MVANQQGKMLTRGPGRPPPALCGTWIAPRAPMEPKAFHICPGCQAQNPASVVPLRRAATGIMAGLPRPSTVPTSTLEMRPNASADLVDLPLRETSEEPPSLAVGREAVPPVATPATQPARRPLPRSQRQTHDGGRGGGDRSSTARHDRDGRTDAGPRAGRGRGPVGTWLVRAQDREEAPPARPRPCARTRRAALAAACSTRAPVSAPRPSSRATAPRDDLRPPR